MEWQFKRGLSDPVVRALNEAYDQGGWWRRAVEDHDLIPAIRNEYLNLYYYGNSLWLVERTSDSFRVWTHFKYMLKSETRRYLESKVDAADGELRSTQRTLSVSSASDLPALKAASKVFASGEKIGVHQIVMKNPNVIDLEIAFCTLKEVTSQGQSADAGVAEDEQEERAVNRLDIAALDGRTNKPRLIFYEAKTFDDRRLRSRAGTPEVLAQLALYEEFLVDQQRSNEP